MINIVLKYKGQGGCLAFERAVFKEFTLLGAGHPGGIDPLIEFFFGDVF